MATATKMVPSSKSTIDEVDYEPNSKANIQCLLIGSGEPNYKKRRPRKCAIKGNRIQGLKSAASIPLPLRGFGDSGGFAIGIKTVWNIL